MKDNITANLTELHGRIADACEEYDRDTNDITVIAVTKTHSAAVIRTAVAIGLHNIGESRIQEAEPKILEVGHIARFHLIGHLQTNKVKKAVQLFDVIHSIDSLKLAREISQRAKELDRTIECLIQVNVSGEERKYGIAPKQTIDLVNRVNDLPNIELTGLMAIGPHTDDEDDIRTAFQHGRKLFNDAQSVVGRQFDQLSMGMSNDYPLAIAEGATMIRIGTAIFGARQPL
ncbi:MAG: YggS family pyridoxal phosphate-dependent enzyme [Candidatus Zixiibacteriota bacterium]|nr:MAG: YggS family pyridoxal phosphate-dependent enzyme [candidate division Zixibacteria bacterium]